MHVRPSSVYLYRVPTVGRDPPWDFGSAQAPIPLCSAARFRSLLAPSRLPRRRLAVPDGMTLGGDAGLTGGQEPLAQQRHRCPGTPPCLPSQSVQGSGVQHPLSQPDLS